MLLAFGVLTVGCGVQVEIVTRTIRDLPLAVLLEDLPYRGEARVSIDARLDVRAKASLLDD